MKMAIIAGLACFFVGTGLAGCGSGSAATETTMVEATTTAETTTLTTEATTTTTESPKTTTEVATNTSNIHPENEQIMNALRNYYDSHEIINGNPVSGKNGVYSKFAIEDFDGDGENELAVQYSGVNNHDVNHIYIWKADKLFFDDTFNELYRGITYQKFDDVTFLDNGVAYTDVPENHYYPDKEYLENKYYHILSNDILRKLDYDPDSFTRSDGSFPFSFILFYTKEDGAIQKIIGSGQDAYFDPVVITQEQYDANKAILYSGSVIEVKVQDFTAESIGS